MALYFFFEPPALLSHAVRAGNVWRRRYVQQHSHNQLLEREVEQLETKLEELKNQEHSGKLV